MDPEYLDAIGEMSPGNSPLSERIGAARRCILCKLEGNDSPGSKCDLGDRPVECGHASPVYSAMLADHLADGGQG